jgi:hypothetical protein
MISWLIKQRTQIVEFQTARLATTRHVGRHDDEKLLLLRAVIDAFSEKRQRRRVTIQLIPKTNIVRALPPWNNVASSDS